MQLREIRIDFNHFNSSPIYAVKLYCSIILGHGIEFNCFFYQSSYCDFPGGQFYRTIEIYIKRLVCNKARCMMQLKSHFNPQPRPFGLK